MLWLQWFGIEKFLLFTLVLTRVSGVCMTAPVLSDNDIPVRVRALFAFAISLLILPTQWHVPIEYPGTTLNYLVFLGAELMVGLCLGLGVTVLLSGLQTGGDLIARLGGLMMANVFDPSSEAQVPVFARLIYLVALAVFVAIGGHRMVMAATLDTFAILPPGGGGIPESLTDAFVTLLAQGFLLGVRAAMPAVVALLLSNLILGLIGRTMPQLNILIVGFGMNAMLTFALLAVSLGSIIWLFQDQIEPALETVLDAVADGWYAA